MESNRVELKEYVLNEELLNKNMNDEFGIESKSIGVVGEGHKGYYFEGEFENGKAFLYSPSKELIGEVIFVKGKINGECKFYKNGKWISKWMKMVYQINLFMRMD